MFPMMQSIASLSPCGESGITVVLAAVMIVLEGLLVVVGVGDVRFIGEGRFPAVASPRWRQVNCAKVQRVCRVSPCA